MSWREESFKQQQLFDFDVKLNKIISRQKSLNVASTNLNDLVDLLDQLQKLIESKSMDDEQQRDAESIKRNALAIFNSLIFLGNNLLRFLNQPQLDLNSLKIYFNLIELLMDKSVSEKLKSGSNFLNY